MTNHQRQILALHRPELFPPVADIIDEDKFAEVLELRIIGTTLVRFGQVFNEVDEVGVSRHHKCADGDFFPPAGDRLVERFIDYPRIQSERILVEPAAVIENRGWFPVGDHKNLLIHGPPPSEEISR